MAKFSLVMLIHAHQPVGNFDDVMERTYEHSYLPFLDCLTRHPLLRVGLHYSGPLLEWMRERHPEYIQQIGALAARGQVEVVGGGFYEPILVTIPPEDQVEQITLLSDFITGHFGKRPGGAWLAERVWEPQLPAMLAEAGVEYTLVDDSHFVTAGREMRELFGYYIAEERGRTVKVIPGLQELRYLLPFGTVDDAIAALRRMAQQHAGGMAAMGDDMEKFGGWPHTYEHCFVNGWLDNFFLALEANQDWLETISPGEALATRRPLGRIDLPTASYSEMMEWVLPTPVRQDYRGLQQEFAGRPDVRRFLRGGFWRGFFSKYAESNLLHKKMLRVSNKLRQQARKRPKSAKAAAERSKALRQLLRAQCNDAYWHGIFGGLYSPQLRTALWRELVRAETTADAQSQSAKQYQTITRLDFDADGKEEIELTSPQFAALVKPANGGTLEILDFRPSGVTLINSLQRRAEAYHDRLRNAPRATAQVASIHEQPLVKEEGLEKHLKYDRWPRSTFRLLLFADGKTQQDYDRLELDECAFFAGSDYEAEEISPQEVALTLEGPLTGPAAGNDPNCALRAVKTLRFASRSDGADVGCRLQLSRKGTSFAAGMTVGLELVLNLLAPNAPDRYFESAAGRQALSWGGIVHGTTMKMVDEWQSVAMEIEACGASEIWVSPIETVSESEEGFERVYQGSQILAVWPLDLSFSGTWTSETALRIRSAR